MGLCIAADMILQVELASQTDTCEQKNQSGDQSFAAKLRNSLVLGVKLHKKRLISFKK